jgi:hypothetical protein
MNHSTPALDEPTPWAAIRHGVLVGLALLALVLPPGAPAPVSASQRVASPTQLRVADLGGAEPSSDLHHMANWIAGSGDNAAMPFVVIDKRAARLYVFDAQARLVDHTAVLLGSAHGDDSVPGIGDKPIAHVLPEERTTPAGRFAGQRGLDPFPRTHEGS